MTLSTWPERAVAVVTGGARGIGEAISAQLVGAGARVIIGDVDDQRGPEVAERLTGAGPGHATFVPLDVTDESAVAMALGRAEQEYGVPTAVFANAGAVGATGRIGDTDRGEWQRTVDLLLTGTFLTVKHAVRAMRPHGAGAVVCTASVAGLRGGLGPHAYTAAKHAVKGLVESVAVEIASDGLRINAVAPGGTVSSLSAGLLAGDVDDLATPYQRLAASSSSGVPTTSEDVAAAACFLASPASARINGTCLVVDGGDDVLASSGRRYYSG